MMDIHKAKDHLATTEERISLAREYTTARSEAYKNKYKLEMILVAHLSMIRSYKANVGVDMAFLMLLEPNFLSNPEHTAEAKGYYKAWKENEAKYKGLERLLGAVESKTTFIQSLMRYERDNT